MKKVSPFKDSPESGREAAVKLIRERIQSLYKDEPISHARAQTDLTHRFWQQHRDDPHPQAAWQRFYEGLSDEEKHSLWNEYHAVSGADASTPRTRATKHEKHVRPLEKAPANEFVIPTFEESEIEPDKPHAKVIETESDAHVETAKTGKQKAKDTQAGLIAGIKQFEPAKGEKKHKQKRSRAHWRPFIISLAVMAFWLLAQYNPLLIAFAKQYVSPGDSLRGPIIVDPNASIEISGDPRIIIPKINVDVPVVYDLGTRDEATIQEALERGVVHYAGTSVPGQAGNNVIVGHSSNNFLNSGKYKFAFVLLDRLELNDTFILHHEGTRYVYKVTNKQVIDPTDFSLTLPTETPTVTLITCTPPGTSWRRLVIQGEQISPAVTQQQLDTTTIPREQVENPQNGIVPGNAPSFWDRITGWF